MTVEHLIRGKSDADRAEADRADDGAKINVTFGVPAPVGTAAA